MGPREVASLRGELKRLGTSGAVYLVPNLLVRGLTFFLTPLYARAMPPADYGTLGVATTIASIVGLALSLSIHGAVTRLHFEYEKDSERRTFYATLLGFLLVFPTVVTVILHVLGTWGKLDVFTTVRFDPHLRLAVWIAYAQCFLPLPTAMYIVREQPGRVALLNVVGGASQLALTLLYVVVFRWGMIGALRAALHSGALTAVVAVVLVARHASLSFSMPVLRRSLAYTIPLVPHALAAWGLSISDRLVLERHVSKEDLGRYAIGYLFSFAVGLFAQSVTTALGPVSTRQLKDPELRHHVPPLGTYTFLAIVLVALGAVAFAPDAVALIAPPAYAGAERVVPWVVLGSSFQGLYLIVSTGTWFSMKTKLIPIVTAVGAVVNVALNIVFVPRYGIMAAAVATAAAYGVMAVLHGVVAHHLFPIAWEVRRMTAIAGIAMGAYAAASQVPTNDRAVSLVVRASIVAVACMLAAWAAGLRRLRLVRARP